MAAARRSVGSFAIALVALVQLAPAAVAHPAAEISAAIVKTTTGSHIVVQPNQLVGEDGDTVKLCNDSAVITLLFSPSPHNKFGGGAGGAPGSGLNCSRAAARR